MKTIQANPNPYMEWLNTLSAHETMALGTILLMAALYLIDKYG